MFGGTSSDIGMDLGTCNTIICMRNKGIVLNEPSVVAVELGTKRVIAVGADAKRMLQRTPDNIRTIRPLRDGVIADLESTEKMIRYFISRVLPRYRFVKPRMVIGIPSSITEVERRAVEESAYKAGAREVVVIEESFAAAIGAGIRIEEPAGHMVVDIGGGTAEISVLSLSGMVVTTAIRVGGDEFDAAIVKYVRNVHNLIIGQPMAEHLKIEIGNAVPDESLREVEVKGTNAANGLPQRFKIGSDQIREALREPIGQIVENVKLTLGRTPPELAADIVERGIVMTGGGALLRGFDRLLSAETGVPVIIAENPMDCVALGAGKYFDFIKGVDNNKSPYDRLNR